MPKITIIGAGSVRYSLTLISDIAKTSELSDSAITLMDIDEERLDAVYNLGQRLSDELGSSLKFEKTKDMEGSLAGADFVINTAAVKGEDHEDSYERYEIMRKVGEKHGYYRGIDAQEFNMVSSYGNLTEYPQLKFALGVAKSMEKVCPDAWLLDTANPVFEITQLIKRETDVKILGLCHGFHGVHEVIEELGLDPDKVDWQIAGVNHGVWLNRFEYEGEDAYPIFDKWIEEEAPSWEPEDHWDMQLSPAAIDMYKFYGNIPIGDTPRNGSWKYNYNLGIKKKWYGRYGGIDNDSERPEYYKELREAKEELIDLAGSPKKEVTTELDLGGEELSGEQHIPIMNALVNDVEARIFPNIVNDGIIEGIPDDVVVEVPAKIDQEGVHPEGIKPDLPNRIKIMYLRPRILQMEHVLEAFKTGDRRVLEEVLVRDVRTGSLQQAQSVLDEIMDLSFNREMKEHYSDS